ncbi:hypothetical protein EVAR_54827_1 [Eumeta japonica]|uniref:Uncharacterized protein n=1 Tax=Eumeta variegata TaxID=151549 RepID=A0A4C1Y0K8_EUMVA|nr:hypothetical protein EVAR_54827_1 [Eumeta japonica]
MLTVWAKTGYEGNRKGPAHPATRCVLSLFRVSGLQGATQPGKHPGKQHGEQPAGRARQTKCSHAWRRASLYMADIMDVDIVAAITGFIEQNLLNSLMNHLDSSITSCRMSFTDFEIC